jgi:hypothetical protein
LHPDQKRAESLPLGAVLSTTGTSNAKQGDGFAGRVDAPVPAPLPVLPPIRCAPGAKTAAAATVSLGKKTLDGLTASGTRAEYTIPAGQIGNDQPITITSEHWISDDLGVVLSSTEHHPMIGDTQFHLDQVERTEPDPSL